MYERKKATQRSKPAAKPAQAKTLPTSIADIRKACASNRGSGPHYTPAEQMTMILSVERIVKGQSHQTRTEFAKVDGSLRRLAVFLDWYMKRSGEYTA